VHFIRDEEIRYGKFHREITIYYNFKREKTRVVSQQLYDVRCGGVTFIFNTCVRAYDNAYPADGGRDRLGKGRGENDTECGSVTTTVDELDEPKDNKNF